MNALKKRKATTLRLQAMRHLYDKIFNSTRRGSQPLDDVNIARSSLPNSTPQPKKINDSIYVWHNPPNPKIEIILFHDINWRDYKQPHLETWTDDAAGFCWPIDTLSVQYPETRILLAWYDAGATKTVNGGHSRLFIVAENLRQDILPILTGDCPLLLVGHGFGGLVIKELVRSVQQERDELANTLRVKELRVTDNLIELDSFLENVRGALLLAPPSLGSSIATATKASERGSLLPSLCHLDAHTAVLNEWFRKWRGVNGCKVKVIWASLPTDVLVLPYDVAAWFTRLTHIVVEASARHDSDDFYTSDTDYFNVCKFRGERDSSFQRLAELIVQLDRQSSPRDLAGWWKMDEGCGQTCRDSSRSRADGTITGPVTWRRSNYGGSLLFDGQTMVACGATASLEGTTPFSLSVWVKVPAAHDEDGVIVQQRGPTSYNGEYQLVVRDDGKPGFWVYGNNANQFELAAGSVIRPYSEENILVAHCAVNDNQWHFVVAVRDDTGGRIYVDGTMAGEARGDAKPLELVNRVFIGYDALAKSGWFQGSLGDVRIYNRALSEVEITTLHERTSKAFN